MNAPPAWLPGGPAMALAFAVAAATVATAAPLATWALSIVAFGLWHVVAELEFVAARCGHDLRRGVGVGLVAGLGAIVAGRVATLLGVGAWVDVAASAEVILAAALCAVAAAWAAAAGRRAAPALLATLTLALLGLRWPTATLLALGALHNWTPLGLLALALPPQHRRRRLALAAALLLGLPALVATGAPARALASSGLWWPAFSPFTGLAIGDALATTLPASLEGAAAEAAFSALVTAQLLHYGAVLHVLPRLIASPPPAAAPARVARWRLPRPLLAAAIVLLAALFVADFHRGRGVYGLAAAVHAYLEWPLLLALLAPLRRHAPLAAPATSGP